jgi:hypothetical protein
MVRRLTLVLPCLLAAPAWALTPEELWSAWQAQVAGFGGTISAEAVPGADGSLTLRNFQGGGAGGALSPLPPESPVQQLVLRPTGDGAVAIDLGLPATFDIPEGADDMGDLRVEPTGLVITARDGSAGIDYEIAAESLRFATLPPSDDPGADDFAAEVWGLRLTFPGYLPPDLTISVGAAMDGFAYVANRTDPFTDSPVSDTNRTQGRLSVTASVTLPQGFDFEDYDDPTDTNDPRVFLEALEQGFALRLDMENGAGKQFASYEGFPFTYLYQSTNEPGQASLSFDRTGLTLAGEFGGGSGSFASDDLPFPGFDVSYGPLSAELRVPFGPESGEFRYMVSVTDLTVGEAAWAALDPQGLIPREPISLVMDLGGRMTLDFATFAAAEEAGMPLPPPELESLEVRAFEVSGAGLRASGTASFAFDSSTGTPVPKEGTATARIEGLDRFLDTLVGLGVVTTEDARNARLGLATVFRPGGAPDTREATIEMRADGSIFANGVQIQ